MTIIILILTYVASVFLTRWMNKKLYQLDNDFDVLPGLWFIPVFGFIGYFIAYQLEKPSQKNWFTGKNW